MKTNDWRDSVDTSIRRQKEIMAAVVEQEAIILAARKKIEGLWRERDDINTCLNWMDD